MGRKAAFKDTTSARHAFRRAAVPLPDEVKGDWRIEGIGNDVWDSLRGWGERALGINGLFGLRFDAPILHHLVGKPRRGLREVKPLALDLGASSLDGRDCVVGLPTPDLGPLWAFVRVEVRCLDADRLIGLDVLGPSRLSVPMPFVLHRHPDN